VPLRPDKDCRKCHQAFSGEGFYCATCLPQVHARIDTARKDDPIRKLYQSSAWKWLSKSVRSMNPICQRIVVLDYSTGQRGQCRNASTLVHHIISPTVDATKFLQASNLAALCDGCHGHMEGTPDWKVWDGISGDYVATVMRKGSK
jgi:hypothetical protein